MSLWNSTRAAAVDGARAIVGFAIVSVPLCLIGAQPARAQSVSQSADTLASRDQSRLEEVIVTATRRADSVNKVPLSITALSQSALEEQNLRSAQDVASAVPGLFITSGNGPQGPAISMRGVSSGSLFAAETTAIYLDDVPLQKRAVGGSGSGSGSPFPQLYDLERVEVLRGPQGTLYGQGAQGGAVRFISPTASLTDYSGTARGEASNTQDGDVNYETGIAFGGPIVADRLGFRVSLWDRYDSGYVDHVFAYTGQTLGRNTNSQERRLGRVSLLLAPTDALKISAGFYTAREQYNDLDSYTENVPAFSVPATASGHAAHTYGPYSYGPFKTIVNCNIGENYIDEIEPCYRAATRTNDLSLVSLKIDYDLTNVSLHSITGYATDENSGFRPLDFGDASSINGGVALLYDLPIFQSSIRYTNDRYTLTQELRATSMPNSGPWSWVAGLFASKQDLRAHYTDISEPASAYEDLIRYVRNTSVTAFRGVPIGADGIISFRDQYFEETEYAAFGEVNYSITERLKAIAGLRYSKNEFTFDSVIGGPHHGYSIPTAANGGITHGDQSANALLPKIGVEYDIDESRILYATASKGARNGGVNIAPFQTRCDSTFAALGISSTPQTFDSDSLWSYELGAKLRMLDGRAQVNTSVFYIDWKDVQVTYVLPSPCGFDYTSNAGSAVSMGGDIQAQLEVTNDLLATFSFAYTDAYYTTAVTGPAPTFKPFILDGDTMPVPPIGISAGLRYKLSILERFSPFVRADYRYRSSYKRSFGPGTAGYNVDTYVVEDSRFASARAGATFDGIEVALFVENLLNSQDLLSRSGGRSCNNASCSSVGSNNPIFTNTTFRPRTIGLAANYKF